MLFTVSVTVGHEILILTCILQFMLVTYLHLIPRNHYTCSIMCFIKIDKWEILISQRKKIAVSEIKTSVDISYFTVHIFSFAYISLEVGLQK